MSNPFDDIRRKREEREEEEKRAQEIEKRKQIEESAAYKEYKLQRERGERQAKAKAEYGPMVEEILRQAQQALYPEGTISNYENKGGAEVAWTLLGAAYTEYGGSGPGGWSGTRHPTILIVELELDDNQRPLRFSCYHGGKWHTPLFGNKRAKWVPVNPQKCGLNRADLTATIKRMLSNYPS